MKPFEQWYAKEEYVDMLISYKACILFAWNQQDIEISISLKCGIQERSIFIEEKVRTDGWRKKSFRDIRNSWINFQ